MNGSSGKEGKIKRPGLEVIGREHVMNARAPGTRTNGVRGRWLRRWDDKPCGEGGGGGGGDNYLGRRSTNRHVVPRQLKMHFDDKLADLSRFIYHTRTRYICPHPTPFTRETLVIR